MRSDFVSGINTLTLFHFQDNEAFAKAHRDLVDRQKVTKLYQKNVMQSIHTNRRVSLKSPVHNFLY